MNQNEAILYLKTTPRAAMDTAKIVQYESAFKNNKEFALEHAKIFPERYEYLHAYLRNDKEVMKAYVTGDMREHFAYANPMSIASHRLRIDKEFVVECMEANKKNLIPIFEGSYDNIKRIVLEHPNVIAKTEALPILKAGIELSKRGIRYNIGDDIKGVAEKIIAFEAMQTSLAEKKPAKQPSLKL